MSVMITYGGKGYDEVDEQSKAVLDIYSSSIFAKLDELEEEINNSGGTVSVDINQQLNKVSYQATGISDDLNKRIDEAPYDRSEN